jgi:hypothetical protein
VRWPTALPARLSTVPGSGLHIVLARVTSISFGRFAEGGHNTPVTQSLNTRLLHWQHLRHIGDWILIGGLVLELLHIASVEWLEIELPSQVLTGRLKAISNIFCTLLIVVGVVWESVAGGNADEVIRQMRAPRFLSDIQQRTISAELKPFAGTSVTFAMESGFDSLSLTGQIVASVKGAGWILQNWPIPIGITLADGLRIGELAGTVRSGDRNSPIQAPCS